MLTIIPLAIIIVSLGVIALIAARHVPKVATLDVSKLPEEREAQLKSSILENQLLRKFDAQWKRLARFVLPITQFSAQWYESLLKRLRRVHRVYRLQGGSPLPDSAGKADIRVSEKVEAAAEALAAGKFAEAESQYLAALKIDSGDPAVYEGLGNVYLAQEKWDEARETFEYVARQWPQNDRAFASLALIEQHAGKLEQAKDHYLHALSINNEEVEYHLSLVDLYLRLNDKEKALSSLQKSQQLAPNNPKILDRLLQLAILLGNKSIAEEALEKIKKVNPDHGKMDELEAKVKDLK